MATYKGKSGSLTLATNAVGELRNFEITQTANEVDTSVMGSDWTGVDSTQNSWTATMTVWWDPDDTGQATAVIGSKVAAIFYPQGNTTSLVEMAGTGLVTSVAMTAAHDNIIEQTIEMTGDGALVTGVVA